MVDRDLAPKLARWGDRQVESETRKAAYRLDPHAAVERARVAEYAAARQHPPRTGHDGPALRRPARRPRRRLLRRPVSSRRHHLYRRGNPWARADHGRHRRRAPDGPGGRPDVPVEIELVMTDTTLLAPAGTPGREEPALVPGYGPVPAGLARDLVLGSGASDDRVPTSAPAVAATPVPPAAGTGELAAMDTPPPRVHRQPAPLPAPTRPDLPHPVLRRPDPARRPRRRPRRRRPHQRGQRAGRLRALQLCETSLRLACTNQVPDGTITTRTPTGHEYRSELPDPPRGHPGRPSSPLEQRARRRARPLLGCVRPAPGSLAACRSRVPQRAARCSPSPRRATAAPPRCRPT